MKLLAVDCAGVMLWVMLCTLVYPACKRPVLRSIVSRADIRFLQVEQHKWAEEGAELKGRLTAHEAQLDLMQVNMRETDQARTNCAQDLARLRVELEKVSTALCQCFNAFRNMQWIAPFKQQK